MIIFGIPNCDTVKKSLKYFDQVKRPYEFYDLRKDGFPTDHINDALAQLGAEKLVNKRSTTWKQLDEQQKAQALDGSIAILEANPTLIKRPLIFNEGTYQAGFKASDWS